MGWKTVNGRRYYYRSKRVGGRVVTQYIGGDRSAELIAKLDDAGRAQARLAYLDERDDRNALDDEERAIAEWCNAVETVARAAIQAAGYHRHHRGEWRKRRVQPTEAGTSVDESGNPGVVPAT
jgi:hypothetical protein